MPARPNELLPPESQTRPHTLTLENRQTLVATGVTRVVSCDESGAALELNTGKSWIGFVPTANSGLTVIS